ncbi:SCA7, zinc-binding domain-containing protein [Gorgonomyces haynaldii]|nr:SCA7, zinc-binding domain-containing protein [Gorgonomyces haynaldii]
MAPNSLSERFHNKPEIQPSVQVTDELRVVECKNCKKRLLEIGLLEHIKTCKMEEEKIKLKVPIKKIKQTLKMKPPEKKRLNLDEMCGVKQDGQVCHRSITCKIHSVSSKRAVVGRSQPYDKLFQQHQAKATINKGLKDAKSTAIKTHLYSIDDKPTDDEMVRIAQMVKNHEIQFKTPTHFHSLKVWAVYKHRMAYMDAFQKT